jgi:hypothetical protein
MSDDVLSVIPTDPYWQPDPAAGARAAAIVESLAPGAPMAVEVDIDVTWHDAPALVGCGQNLERIRCPLCGAEIDTGWWGDLMDVHDEDGFTTLAVEVPCCAAATSGPRSRRTRPGPSSWPSGPERRPGWSRPQRPAGAGSG